MLPAVQEGSEEPRFEESLLMDSGGPQPGGHRDITRRGAGAELTGVDEVVGNLSCSRLKVNEFN